MNIAILGGSFDPPHLGHVWVARQILDYRADIDHILLVPANKHQWKPIVASVEDRVQMVKMLEDKNIRLSNVEIDRGGISYTVDTVMQIKKETGANLFWIVGSDILTEYDRWDNAEDITSHATFLVFPRDPHRIPDSLPPGFEVIREQYLITSNISSTAIRERIKQKRSITGFVPQGVEKYITEKKIYR